MAGDVKSFTFLVVCQICYWGMNTLCETFKGILVTCAPKLKIFKWQTSDFYARCQTEQNFTYQTSIIYRISVDIKITSTVIWGQLLCVDEGKGIWSNNFWRITYLLRGKMSSYVGDTQRKNMQPWKSAPHTQMINRQPPKCWVICKVFFFGKKLFWCPSVFLKSFFSNTHLLKRRTFLWKI